MRITNNNNEINKIGSKKDDLVIKSKDVEDGISVLGNSMEDSIKEDVVEPKDLKEDVIEEYNEVKDSTVKVDPLKRKPIYKKVGFWVALALAGVAIAGAVTFGGDLIGNDGKTPTTESIAKNDSKQSTKKEDVKEDSKKVKQEANISAEKKTAVKQAQNYVDNMDFSKNGLWYQLTSEYGGKFSKEDASYAVNHIDVDWKQEALSSAKNYRDAMSMSNKAIYDQLVSEYGDRFTPEQAKYAIDNIDKK